MWVRGRGGGTGSLKRGKKPSKEPGRGESSLPRGSLFPRKLGTKGQGRQPPVGSDLGTDPGRDSLGTRVGHLTTLAARRWRTPHIQAVDAFQILLSHSRYIRLYNERLFRAFLSKPLRSLLCLLTIKSQSSMHPSLLLSLSLSLSLSHTLACFFRVGQLFSFFLVPRW
jgi:hypothetical protein